MTSRRPSPALRRALLAAAVALGVLALAGVAAVVLWRGAFLRAEGDGRLAAWAGRRPDRLAVSWREARSRWPGHVEVTGLRVAGRTSRLVWEVTAERASGWLSPLPLLWREVRWRGVEASGLVVRAAHPLPLAGDRRQPEAADLPRIEGFPGPPVPRRSAKRWSFSMRNLDFEDLREVWVDDRRLVGSLRGHGGWTTSGATGTAEVHDSRVELSGVRLTAAGEQVADAVSGTASLRIRPWKFRGARARDVASDADGALDVAGEVHLDAVLGYLFEGWPGLELESGGSSVEAHLAASHGRLRPGSRLHLASRRQRVRFLGFEAAGDAELTARVTGGLAGSEVETTMELGNWTMGRPGERPFMLGRGLRLDATARDPRLDRRPRGGRLALDLGEARIPDLGVFDEMVPASSDLGVEGGSATVAGRLDLSTELADSRGSIRVDASDFALRAGGESLQGDLEARLELSAPDLERLALAVDGSRVVLRDLTASTAAADGLAPWSATVSLPRGELVLARPPSLEAEVQARLQDTRPLVAFYQLRRDLPRWAERLLTIEGVSVSGRLDWSPGRLRFDRGFVPLPHGELRGDADLAEATKRARLLYTWRRLAAGVELADGESDLHLVGAREWWASCCEGGGEGE